MSRRIHSFAQGGVDGAAIQVAEADTWDLNQMLTPENRLSGDATVPFTYACAYIRHHTNYLLTFAKIILDHSRWHAGSHRYEYFPSVYKRCNLSHYSSHIVWLNCQNYYVRFLRYLYVTLAYRHS